MDTTQTLRRILLSSTTCLLVLSTNASASDHMNGNALQQEMQSLKQRLAQLEKQLHTVKGKQKENESAYTVVMKPGPLIKAKDGSFSAKLDGFVQMDSAFFTGSTADHPDGTSIKRARIGLKGNLAHDWGYRLLTEFGDNQAKLVDGNLSYNGLDKLKLTIGQFKEPFSLEQLTPAKYFTFLEKASLASLSPKRSIGLAGHYTVKNWNLTAGLFGENVNKKRSNDEGHAVTGRITYAPWHEKSKVLHFGLAGTWRGIDGESSTVRYKSAAENGISTLKSVDTGKLANAESTQAAGLELLGIYGPYSLQAEYIRRQVSFTNQPDASFDAYYLQASWLLTGESRPYKFKKGAIGRQKVSQPFSLKDGGLGAWEIAARHSVLDLSDDTVSGGTMRNSTVGVNWYANDYVKTMVNYVHSRTDSEAPLADDTAHIVMLRAQFEF